MVIQAIDTKGLRRIAFPRGSSKRMGEELEGMIAGYRATIFIVSLFATLISASLCSCKSSSDSGNDDLGEDALSSFSLVNDYCYSYQLDILYDKSYQGSIQYIVGTTNLGITTKAQFEASTATKTALSIAVDDRLYDDYIPLTLARGTAYYIHILDEASGEVKTLTRSTVSDEGYTMETGTISGNSSGYADYTIYFPKGYSASGSKTWPILVTIKARSFVDINNYFPCIVFDADVNGSGSYLTNDSKGVRDKVKSIIENSSYKIDKSKVYILGFSAGGCAAVTIANNDNSAQYQFKSLAAFGVSSWVGTTTYGDNCSSLGPVHVWLFVGENDATFGPQTVTAYNGIKTNTPGRTGELLLSTVVGFGHDASPVWKSPVVLKWLVDR